MMLRRDLYRDWDDDPAKVRTDIYIQLKSAKHRQLAATAPS